MDTYIASASGIALTAESTKTLMQIATTADIRAKLIGLDVTFDGDTSGLPEILVELLRQTTAGTGTGVTPVKADSAAPTAIVTAAKAHSSEPTASSILRSWYVDPHDGKILWREYDPEAQIRIPASGYLGVRYTSGAGVTVNAAVNMIWSE